MTATKIEPTPEQSAWDKKSRYYTRNSWIAVGALLALNIGSFIWVVADKIVPYFAFHTSGLATSEPARSAAFADFGPGLGLLLAILMVTAALSLPLRRTIGTAFWALGDRPTDDFKTRGPDSAEEISPMTGKITTPGGYTYDEPDITGQPDVVITLPYAEAYDVILDGIMNAATLEPITAETFKGLAQDLLGLLIDASEETDVDERFLD
jgi:hypothetical protein